MPAALRPRDASPKRRNRSQRRGVDRNSQCSSGGESAPPTKHTRAEAACRELVERIRWLAAARVQLLCLEKRVSCQSRQTDGLLAPAQFKPQYEMSGIPFDGLLQEFEREGKLLIVIANPRGEPGREPIVRGQHQSLL